MWWAGSKVWDVYLAGRAFMAGQGGDCTHQETVQDLDQALQAMGRWVGEQTNKVTVRVWLGGSLCRPFAVQAVPGVKGKDEWVQVATAMAADRTGLTGPCLVHLDTEPGAQAALAVAMPTALLEQLQALEFEHKSKVRLQSVRPWWAQALAVALLRDASLQALAVQDGDALTLLAGKDKGFELASTVTPLGDRDAGSAAVARALFVAGLETDSVLEVWLDADSAVRPAQPTTQGNVSTDLKSLPFGTRVEFSR